MELTLADEIELFELVGRYGDAVDDRNWAALDSIFASDAIFKVPSVGAEMVGLIAIKHYMKTAGKLHPAAHLMTNIHSFIEQDVVHLRFRAVLPMNKVNSDSSTTIIHGSYYDQVVNTPHGWRVKHRLFSHHRVNNEEVSS